MIGCANHTKAAHACAAFLHILRTTAKTTAKTNLDGYVNVNDYRLAQQEELATAIANGKTAIDNATDLRSEESRVGKASASSCRSRR